MKKLKVKDLKKALENVPDDMDVVYGWQFNAILQARVDTVSINGEKTTAFQLIDDPDLID
jgi:hypothetical protein